MIPKAQISIIYGDGDYILGSNCSGAAYAFVNCFETVYSETSVTILLTPKSQILKTRDPGYFSKIRMLAGLRSLWTI